MLPKYAAMLTETKNKHRRPCHCGTSRKPTSTCLQKLYTLQYI